MGPQQVGQYGEVGGEEGGTGVGAGEGQVSELLQVAKRVQTFQLHPHDRSARTCSGVGNTVLQTAVLANLAQDVQFSYWEGPPCHNIAAAFNIRI